LIKDFLAERFGIPRSRIDEVIKDQVEQVVFSFFGWIEGNFSFELMEVENEITQLKNPWRQFVLDQGLSPQYLAGFRMSGGERKRNPRLEFFLEKKNLKSKMRNSKPDLQRRILVPWRGEEEFEIKDEEFKTGSPEADFSSVAEFLKHYEEQQQSQAPASAETNLETPAPSSPNQEIITPAQAEEVPAAKEPEQAKALIIVADDEPLILKAVKDYFEKQGYQVEGFEQADSAFARIKELVSKNQVPLMVADLIMPEGTGRTLLGGLELLKETRTLGLKVPFILTTDYENQPAQKQAEKLGVDFFFFKPKSSLLDEELESPELNNFLQVLENAIKTCQAQIPPPEKKEEKEEGMFDLAEELRKELGEEELIVPEPPQERSRGLDILRNMIQELNDPSSNGQMTLLVLRFAAELMNRAVIFVVGKNYVAGLGQFGIELDGTDPEKQVRKMRIPLNEPSIFQEVIEKRIPLKKKLKPTKWNQYLIENLGGIEPREVFVAPIISSGKVAAILYGDNVPEDKEIGDTESLEIFLVQVGLAMEKALLERMLKEMGKEHTPQEKAG